MMTSLRKSFRETSEPAPAPKFHTLFAHASNSVSWVTPRSRVTGSYSVRPGDLWLVLGSPPSRCDTTSVVRRRALILLTPATYRPSHLILNLKFLYGSKRCGFTLNCAQAPPSPVGTRPETPGSMRASGLMALRPASTGTQANGSVRI